MAGMQVAAIMMWSISPPPLLIRVGLKTALAQNSSGGGSSSFQWMKRQQNDPLVKKAQDEGYRARSAYKLLEIDAKHKLLTPGQILLECGAAPGAWTQVAVKALKEEGRILAVDLLPIEPIDGAELLPEMDFTAKRTQAELKRRLDGQLADLVLSDMAPNASGNRSLDHAAIVKLAYSALRFSVLHSRVGASFLCKIWHGERTEHLVVDLKKFYKEVHRIKPDSSRIESSEIFLLARGFRGMQKKQQ